MRHKTPKLVVNNDAKPEPQAGFGISIGVSMDVKYANDEVTLVRLQNTYNGSQEEPHYILVEHNKE